MYVIGNFINRQRVINFMLKNYIKRGMNQKIVNCYIQPVDNSYKSITLPHNETICVGRNHESLILDTLVSKKQMFLKANYDTKSIECVCQGVNICGCNGYALRKQVRYVLKDGDRLEIVLGKYIYEIIFEYSETDEGGPRKKLKLHNRNHNLQQSTPLPDNIKGDWQFIENSLLIYTPDIDLKGNRIASFDLDGTLIKTKSGQKFPKDKNDWVFTFGNIQQKLKDLYLQGYRIVIFSNQLKLSQEKQMISGFKEKIENIICKLGIPIQVFLAIQRDIFRKPAPGMWNNLLDSINEDVNLSESFYVGDAAGRQKNWAPHKSKDHSIADRLFTLNIDLKFYTPEEYFLGIKSVPYVMPEFDPRTVTSFTQTVPFPANQEAVIMVGSQGSGKTHFCENNLVTNGYVYINRDTLGSKQKCLNLVEECLKMKKSVVVDNTNPDIESRKPYIDLCKKYQVSCRCFHVNIPHKHCKHNNKFRSLTDRTHAPVSDIIINSYRKKFQVPTLEEGFSEIHEFRFNAVFKNKDHEKLYRMFLLES